MATRNNWVGASKGSPCPICKDPSWCSVSADGAVAKCMRVEEGSFKAKEDCNGGRYFLHRLIDTWTQGMPIQAVVIGTEPQRADPDTLNNVYTALLSKLKLTESHRANLRLRGLTDELIDCNGYKTLPIQGRARIARDLRERFGDKLLRVPGFVVQERNGNRHETIRGPAGIAIPVRDDVGRIVALKVRCDRRGIGGPKYVYVTSTRYGGPGPGSPVHTPLGTPTQAELVRLTEGELKADTATALGGLATISIPGVSTWKVGLPSIA